MPSIERERCPRSLNATKKVRTDDNVPIAKNPWHAVAIVPSRASCVAARAFKGMRFLSADAPALPLEQCTQPTACRCTYRKHADRREEARRAEDAIGIRRWSPVSVERRQSRGRRSTDR
jgi:hypothetical protein